MSRHEIDEPLHRPAHLAALRDPAPWSRRSATRRAEARAKLEAESPAPVFVDDSGRRREVGRMVGVGVGVVVLAYLVVVGLTFAGAPLGGTLAPPGVEDLSRPSGSIGDDAQEYTLPPGAFAPGSAPDTTLPGGETSGTTGDGGTSDTTVEAPDTTATTAPPSSGTTTTTRTSNSTVPTRTTHTAPDGPPDEPPGKP